MLRPMKHLILLRHASAGEATPDRARPLSARGHDEVLRLCARISALEALGFAPRLALCSGAERAWETLVVVRPALSGLARVERDESLYLASPGAMLSRLQALAETEEQVLLVGHNPGLSQLARSLAANGEPGALARLAARGLATANAAALRLPRAWADLAPGSAELVALISR